MRAMIFDSEILPEDAKEFRESRLFSGFTDWESNPFPPQSAYDTIPLPDVTYPKEAPQSIRNDPTKLEAFQKKAYADAVSKNYNACSKRSEQAMKHWRDGSLKPYRAMIHCISWRCGEAYGTCQGEERELLEEFNFTLDKFSPSHLVAWNAEFDVSMIFTRAMKHRLSELAKKVKLPHHAVRAQFRMYKSQPEIIDAMKVWGQSYTKLEHACQAMGVDHSLENPINGSEVLDAYMNGRDMDISMHCEADVRDLAAVWERLEEIYPQFKSTWQSKPLPVIRKWSTDISSALGPDPE